MVQIQARPPAYILYLLLRYFAFDMKERPLEKAELELLAHILTKVEVTSENLPVLRRQVAEIREEKGLEDDALKAIKSIREGAERVGAHEDVANFYWERHLVNQHLVMYELEKPEGERNQEVMDSALKEMEEASLAGDEYITVHNLTDLKKYSHRFLGKVASYKGRHDEAEIHYREMAGLYEEIGHPRRLEAYAAIAGTLIMQGKIAEGMGLGRRTYADFDQSEDGKTLREEDFSTWAVWKSGAAVHVSQGLLATNTIDPFKEGIIDWLIDAKEVVEDPRNRYRIRIDEIESLIKRIQTL